MPAAIMVWEPAPGLIGNPSPAPQWTIAPTPDRIRRPGHIDIKGNPSAAVIIIIDPAAVSVQFRGSHKHCIRQVPGAGIGLDIRRAPVIPFIPGIALIVVCDFLRSVSPRA
jgi:hypothetical protein